MLLKSSHSLRVETFFSPELSNHLPEITTLGLTASSGTDLFCRAALVNEVINYIMLNNQVINSMVQSYFLKIEYLLSYSRNFQRFNEQEGSLPCS